jgi:glycosyltransferase involved in cell wall biosynthesis
VQPDQSSKAPLVSVVVPAYGAAPYISATLDSIFAQSCQDLEVIVVNDGSPDTPDLERVLAPYRDRIVYLRQENQGPAVARNTGIRAARGEFVAPLDSDDLWYPECLAAQLEAMRADPSLDMIYADARVFGDVQEAGRTLMELSPPPSAVTFERLLRRQCVVNICVSLIRRETLFGAGLFDPAVRGTEDADMWLRITLRGGRIGYQRKVLGQYRRRAGSLSSSFVTMMESYLSVLRKLLAGPELSAAQREAVEQQIRAECASLEMQRGRAAFLAGDIETAIRYLSRANEEQRSLRMALVIQLLRTMPGLLQTLYRRRYPHLYESRP